MAQGICKNCDTEFQYYPSQSKGIYCSNKCQGQDVVKKKLVEDSNYREGIRRYINELYDSCSECGVGREYNGKTLILQVDHINGNNRDNRIENLRLLCPNCHSQTETWGNPNKRIGSSVG